MIGLKINSKRFIPCVKGITFLALALTLQGKTCIGHVLEGNKTGKIDLEKLRRDTDHKKFIAFSDQERDSYIFHLVKKQKHRALEECLKLSKATDFNYRDPKSKNTALEQAIQMGSIDTFNLFMQTEGIDTKAIHPISGNTILHLAIQNKQQYIAKELIKHFNRADPALLFSENKDKNTPLHLAMQHELPDVQIHLLKLVPKEKLWIANNQGDDVVDVAIQHLQVNGMPFLMELPLERLCRKNTKNGDTLLHAAARLNFSAAVNEILERIYHLAGKDEAVKQLFERTKQGKSVWESIYLSRFGLQPTFYDKNIQIFRDAIAFVQDHLTPTDLDKILEDIDRRASSKSLAGGINQKYADALRAIVHKASAFAKQD